mmetsp:Transcript_77881/g.137950  ORF Transcript_77881/g.137950 Transcript_77881/m.137950 type:complete len:253 (+) Transcript_77881:1359-2117(+)
MSGSVGMAGAPTLEKTLSCKGGMAPGGMPAKDGGIPPGNSSPCGGARGSNVWSIPPPVSANLFSRERLRLRRDLLRRLRSRFRLRLRLRSLPRRDGPAVSMRDPGERLRFSPRGRVGLLPPTVPPMSLFPTRGPPPVRHFTFSGSPWKNTCPASHACFALSAACACANLTEALSTPRRSMGGTQQARTSPNAEKTPFKATRFACSVIPPVISSVRPLPLLAPAPAEAISQTNTFAECAQRPKEITEGQWPEH